MPKRLLVIGLDCADPRMVFEDLKDDMPNVHRLMREGAWGTLRSSEPPITVPAWSCMTSGKDAGTLGIYGFRNRADHSYENLRFATSLAVKEPRVWDLLSRAGKDVIALGVPGTFPPRKVKGLMVGCFLTPSIHSEIPYTYPPQLRDEIADVVGEYLVDADNFRTERKAELLDTIYEMTQKRFDLAAHFANNKPWDLFMMVEMGTDRIHHAFWKFYDAEHPNYEPDSPFATAIGDYYRYVDGRIGELLDLVGDETAVVVVSDHGVRGMAGGICINEWLQQRGYLKLLEQPGEPIPIGKAKVDWKGTVAWGEGGYYSRIFMNVEGREPEGVVPQGEYEAVRDRLKEELEGITDEEGRSIGTRVVKPEEVYEKVNGVAPDLICYLGDLSWRSIGTVGGGRVHVSENDTGPDDANHDYEGIFVARGLDGLKGPVEMDITDFAPTVLDHFGVPVPDDVQGRSLLPGGYTPRGA
jgi:predicted AlkP superfamily phosphohydrolase/phosphomutase